MNVNLFAILVFLEMICFALPGAADEVDQGYYQQGLADEKGKFNLIVTNDILRCVTFRKIASLLQGCT